MDNIFFEGVVEVESLIKLLPASEETGVRVIKALAVGVFRMRPDCLRIRLFMCIRVSIT